MASASSPIGVRLIQFFGGATRDVDLSENATIADLQSAVAENMGPGDRRMFIGNNTDKPGIIIHPRESGYVKIERHRLTESSHNGSEIVKADQYKFALLYQNDRADAENYWSRSYGRITVMPQNTKKEMEAFMKVWEQINEEIYGDRAKRSSEEDSSKQASSTSSSSSTAATSAVSASAAASTQPLTYGLEQGLYVEKAIDNRSPLQLEVIREGGKQMTSPGLGFLPANKKA